MAVKTFTTGEVLTASDTNTYLANSGLVYVKTQTITGTPSTVTVSSAFSSSYDNYRIIVNATGSSQMSVGVQMGASATGYYGFLIYGDIGSNAVTGFSMSNNSLFRFVGGGTGAGTSVVGSFDLLNPYAAAYTRVPTGPYWDTNSMGQINAEHRVATSYTDFVLVAGSGNFTGGTITVYGYRKG